MIRCTVYEPGPNEMGGGLLFIPVNTPLCNTHYKNMEEYMTYIGIMEVDETVLEADSEGIFSYFYME